MPEQQQLFDPTHINLRQFSPPSFVQVGARQYAEQKGLSWSDAGLDNTRVDPERGHGQFLAYRDAMKAPEAPGIRQSYEAMRSHLNDQYDFMTRPGPIGMGVKHTVVDHDPYSLEWSGGNDAAAESSIMHDVGQNRTIKTLATSTTGPHEFFSNEENDKFRAVHDVFGHVATGRGVDRSGEEAAFQSHRQMFPPEAHAALASETRGQNSYLNYGKMGFPSQEGKIVGLPDWASKDGALPPPRQAPVQRGQQGALF